MRDNAIRIQRWWRNQYLLHYRECPVCYGRSLPFVSPYRCDHQICEDCYHQWMVRNNTCPCCREPGLNDQNNMEVNNVIDYIDNEEIPHPENINNNINVDNQINENDDDIDHFINMNINQIDDLVNFEMNNEENVGMFSRDLLLIYMTFNNMNNQNIGNQNMDIILNNIIDDFLNININMLSNSFENWLNQINNNRYDMVRIIINVFNNYLNNNINNINIINNNINENVNNLYNQINNNIINNQNNYFNNQINNNIINNQNNYLNNINYNNNNLNYVAQH